MSEEIIIDGVNVAGCRHCMYKSFKAFPQCRLELDSFATTCTQHKECEYKQLKHLEQKYTEVLTLAKQNADSNEYCLQDLEKENKHLDEQVRYLKKCCNEAGQELEKHSFMWDYKEKNLVLQAMELNERYEKLEQKIEAFKMSQNEADEIMAELKHENEELKHKNENLRIALSTYEMPEVVKVLTDWRTGELQLQENRLNKYKSALEEIREKLKVNCWDYTDITVCKIKDDILDKINKVLESEGE